MAWLVILGEWLNSELGLTPLGPWRVSPTSHRAAVMFKEMMAANSFLGMYRLEACKKVCWMRVSF